MIRMICIFVLTSALCVSLSGCLGLIWSSSKDEEDRKERMSNDKSRRGELIQRIKQQENIEKEKKRQAIAAKARVPREGATGTDEKIQAQLTSLLLGGGLTKIISVHAIVKGGVVTLYGNVPSPKVARRAIEIARRIQGVKSIVSNLIVVEYNIVPSISKPSVTKTPQKHPNTSIRRPRKIQPSNPVIKKKTRSLVPRSQRKKSPASTKPTAYIAPQAPAEILLGTQPNIITEEQLPWKTPQKTERTIAPVTIKKPINKAPATTQTPANKPNYDNWEVPEFVR